MCDIPLIPASTFPLQTFYPDSKPRIWYFSELINKIADTLLNFILFALLGTTYEVYHWCIFFLGFQFE